MNQVCTILNDKTHTSIQKLIEIDADKPFDVSELDIDKFITEMDPDIWSAVCQLTHVAEIYQKPTNQDDPHKKDQKFFLHMCTIFLHKQPMLIPHSHVAC